MGMTPERRAFILAEAAHDKATSQKDADILAGNTPYK
jgi:hypothetical protein